ncbi:sensor histidine kinase [Cellulosilyticum sp. I15G10I2]|uniref:sensor histidine kinase n=1 Tax=Cellulosilyticum sp. I15G10I2 TaxID=1892843 RepID=UPI00085CA965|nr:HAMP domain-containing sensor histidine kinase [Cellulosilyticum sp. I15G10I2]
MVIKEIIIKTLKQALEMIIIIGIATFNLDTVFKQSIWINLCTALMILSSMSGLFVVFSHLDNKQNNKANMIGVGYAAISVLLILKFYHNVFVHMQIQGLYANEKAQFMIDLLEIICLLAGIRYVSHMTNIKKYMMLSLGILIGAIAVSYRVDFSEVVFISDNLKDMSVISMRVLLFIITSCAMVFCYNNADQPHSTNVYRFLLVLALQGIYQGVYIILYQWTDLVYDSFLAILKVIIYVNVFLFVYHDTLHIIWKSKDKDLKGKKKKLIEDTKQKNILILVSEKLQEYVKQIDEAAQNLQEKVETNYEDKKLKYVKMIKQNGYRLEKLAHNIKALNQIETGVLLPYFVLVDIAELIQQIIDSIEPYASAMHVQIEFIREKHKIYCYIDIDFIERIMLNLLSNAIKYNKENGKVYLYINTRKDNVYLCVKDTGLGIPSHKLSTIFNRFERGDAQTTRKKEGSGLGLPIVKSLVEAHKGTISVISKVNYGTTISMQFPEYKGMNIECSHYADTKKEALQDKIKVEFSDLKI